MTITDIPNIELNNGVEIPQVGFGTWLVKPAEAQRVVEDALETGYRHLDTAAVYGNEVEVGAALAASGLPREDVFVTTKLWNKDHGYDAALRAFETSRRKLGIDVVDLYLIHWPVPGKDLYVETWRAFEKLLADGAVRAIGVSNFLPEHLERLLTETDAVPAVNQFELHPTFQQRDVQAASRAAGLAIESYSPLGHGSDLGAPVVVDLAERLGVTPGQVLLRWHVQHGFITIPKSTNRDRIAANLDVFSFELGEADMAAIDDLEAGNRTGADPATANFE